MDKKIQTISPLVDQFSRTISYLRLSITDHCNLRCIYCMPKTDQLQLAKNRRFLPHSELLSYEELLRVVRCAVSLGMIKLRLTGGEPLMRRDLLGFIQELRKLDGLEKICLTTNGVLLERYAEELYQSGVRQLNISLDTLQRQKFQEITGRDAFQKVYNAIFHAQEMGFFIKLNIVAMKGVNDDEFADFARLALNSSVQVRFIEFMPAGDAGSWQQQRFIAVDQIRQQISTLGLLEPQNAQTGAGPAQMFTLKTEAGGEGSIGFISPLSHHFCDRCNRLRLTAEGRLRACLLHDYETDLKKLLRSGASDTDLLAAIRATVFNKPKGHGLQTAEDAELHNLCGGKMSRIGG